MPFQKSLFILLLLLLFLPPPPPPPKDGFVGCIRAFTVNGHLMDLVLYAEAEAVPDNRQSGTAVASQGKAGDLVETKKLAFGVLRGCVGKCDSSPCFNGGECEERYDSFWCDCTFTAFRCARASG